MGLQQGQGSHPVIHQGQYHSGTGGTDVFDMHKTTRSLQPQLPQQHHQQQPAQQLQQQQQQTYQHLSGQQQQQQLLIHQSQNMPSYYGPAVGHAGPQGVGSFGHVEHPGPLHDAGNGGAANLPYMSQHSSPGPRGFVPAGMGPSALGHPGLHLDANGTAAFHNYLLKAGPAG